MDPSKRGRTASARVRESQRAVARGAARGAWSVFSCLLLSSPALAFEPMLDHRGSIGVRAAAVGEYFNNITISADGRSFDAWLVGGEAGFTTWFNDEGDELSLRARFEPQLGLVSLLGGVRKFAGRDQWKTFLDADLTLSLAPGVFGGVRLGGGVLWDPTRPFGVWAGLGAMAEIGASIRVRFDASIGAQVRFDVARR